MVDTDSLVRGRSSERARRPVHDAAVPTDGLTLLRQPRKSPTSSPTMESNGVAARPRPYVTV